MYILINKINFYHSIIFFLFSCFIALIVNQFEKLIISPMVCLFLILSIGISHGALDNQKGKKLSQLYNIKKSYFFLFNIFPYWDWYHYILVIFSNCVSYFIFSCCLISFWQRRYRIFDK